MVAAAGMPVIMPMLCEHRRGLGLSLADLAPRASAHPSSSCWVVGVVVLCLVLFWLAPEREEQLPLLIASTGTYLALQLFVLERGECICVCMCMREHCSTPS